MSLALLLVALAVVGVVAAVAAGVVGGGLAPPPSTSGHRPLPPGPLTPADVDGLRFSRALRGYRMDEVDAVLARLRDELAASAQRAEHAEDLEHTQHPGHAEPPEQAVRVERAPQPALEGEG